MMSEYRKIDLTQYSRKQQFDYFNTLAYPYMGLTVNVDITEWLKQLKQKEYPFFLSFLYAVTRVANTIPEFRQRIVNGEIIEYTKCSSSYTVALENHSYCYCSVDCDMQFADFLPYAKRAQEDAKHQKTLDDGQDALSLFFISTTTNISYTSIVQPVPQPADSNPRITWGRYFTQDNAVLIPVSLLCNHALMDAYQLGLFYENLEDELRSEQWQ